MRSTHGFIAVHGIVRFATIIGAFAVTSDIRIKLIDLLLNAWMNAYEKTFVFIDTFV